MNLIIFIIKWFVVIRREVEPLLRLVLIYDLRGSIGSTGNNVINNFVG